MRTLLTRLEDPFEMFPVESVERSLADLMAMSVEAINEISGWNGPPRNYYSVEQEHHVEVIANLIGSIFVLGQTTITQAVAIAKRIHRLAGEPEWLPKHKARILETEAIFHIKTRQSEIILFDAVANYFKHHWEWPDTWNVHPHSQTQTIVRDLGLSPNYDREENLHTALQSLGLSTRVETLGSRIQSWRERLAENLRRQLLDHGFAP